MDITKKNLTVEFENEEDFAFFFKRATCPKFENIDIQKKDEGLSVEFTYKDDRFVDDVKNTIALKDFTIQDAIEYVVNEEYQGSYEAMCFLEDLGFEREKTQSEIEDNYIFEGDRDDALNKLGLEKMIEVIGDVLKEKRINYTSLSDMIESKGTITDYEACCEVAQDIYNNNKDLFDRYTPDIIDKLKTGEEFHSEDVEVDERG